MTGRHRTMAAAVLCVDLALLVATSEPPPAVEGPAGPECDTVDIRTDPLDVDAEGALSLELIADELGIVEGSVWVFADRERACRAEVSFADDAGAGVVSAPGQGDGGGQAPAAQAVASWIAAGSAWEVPVALDGADGPVLVEIGACPGATVELELAADACGEVDVVVR